MDDISVKFKKKTDFFHKGISIAFIILFIINLKKIEINLITSCSMVAGEKETIDNFSPSDLLPSLGVCLWS